MIRVNIPIYHAAYLERDEALCKFIGEEVLRQPLIVGGWAVERNSITVCLYA